MKVVSSISAIGVCLLSVLTCAAGDGGELNCKCAANMENVWRMAWNQIVLEAQMRGVPYENVGTSRIVAASVLLPLSMKTCPDNGPYGDFSLVNGPVCPKGHCVSTSACRIIKAIMNCPSNTTAFLDRLRDDSEVIRETTVWWVLRCRMNEEDRTLVLNAALTNSAQRVRSYVAEQQRLIEGQ